MKLLKQNSSILPNLKFKKLIKFDENQKTTKVYYRPKLILLKENKNIDLNYNLLEQKEKNDNNENKENKENKEIDENKKRSISNKIINNKEQSNLNNLKNEIEFLKNQLNDEKLKSKILKEIAEEEQKKHILYKKKYQTIIISNEDLIDKIKIKSSKKILAYKDGKDNHKDNVFFLKNLNNCNSISKETNNNEHISFKRCLSSPRQECLLFSQTIPINNKSYMIKNLLLNKKKIKLTNIKKSKEEINELRKNNFKKEKIIEELQNQIKELKEKNNQLLTEKKMIEEDFNKLKEEINFKDKEIEAVKLKLNEELDINQKYINKFKEIKSLNEKFINKLQYEKEQNKKLKKLLDINKKEKNWFKEDNNCEKSFDENTNRSLKINGLKDISNISCIEQKQQNGQCEAEDMTLKEIFQNKLLESKQM